LSQKIILKYADKFDDSTLNELLEHIVPEGTKIGNVIKTKNESYAFIESDGLKYFGHISDFNEFKNEPDLRRLKEGQLVTFEIANSYKGPCAKNITTIISR